MSSQLKLLSERRVQPTIIAHDGTVRTAIDGQLSDWLIRNQVSQLEDRTGRLDDLIYDAGNTEFI